MGAEGYQLAPASASLARMLEFRRAPSGSGRRRTGIASRRTPEWSEARAAQRKARPGVGRALRWTREKARTLLFTAILLPATMGAACESQSKKNDTAPTAEPSAQLELEGVDTKNLTPREREQWGTAVSELLAPCPDQPVNLAQCVREQRPCEACLPATRFLARQVTAGKSPAQLEAAYRLRFGAAETVEVGNSPIKGDVAAPVTIVEWADFQCPFCAMAAPVLHKVVEANPGRVRLVFKHFPLSGHEHAETAARAAVAAQKQGKFWEMHHALFSNQQNLDEKLIEKLAAEVGLDVKQFNADRRSEAVVDQVAADRKQAERLGLKGTPMIYVNGRRFDLEQFDLLEDLDEWIALDAKLAAGKATKPPAEGTAAKPGATEGD